jgi:hypothetical protein
VSAARRRPGSAQRPVPEDLRPGALIIDVYDGRPDDFGRTRFVAWWCDSDRVRGQVFYARVADVAARFPGLQVTVHGGVTT